MNAYGMIRGLHFLAFILQYYGFMLNILVLNLQRVSEMAGSSQQMKRMTLSNGILVPTLIQLTIEYNYKRCWLRDCYMRLIKHDINLGHAVFWNVKQGLPWLLTMIKSEGYIGSNYSRNNLPFEILDLVRFLLKSSLTQSCSLVLSQSP